MSSQRFLKPTLALLTALALSGCSGSEPSGNVDGTGTGPLLPMSTGYTWEYRVTADSVVTQKRTTVFAKEAVGGTGHYAAQMAFKVETRKGPDLNVEMGLDKTESWQAPASDKPERIVRFRELAYNASTQLLVLEEFWEPPRIHIDGTAERTKLGTSWQEIYTEHKLPAGVTPPPMPVNGSDRWEVLGVDVPVDVAGMRFEHAIHLQKTAGTNSVKEYWYVRGIGKVKEVGNQTEELVSYYVGGATP